MWWKRKPKVNPFTPKVPETAEEMANFADKACERITRMLYHDLLEKIYHQSNGGNKSYSIPVKFFDDVTITYVATGERVVLRPTIDFKLLKTLLTDKGFNVTLDEFGRIVRVCWAAKK